MNGQQAPCTPTSLPRCGDVVFHRPSGQTWEVAWAHGDELAWFGWPDGRARLSDCDLVERCSAEDHVKAVSQWLDREHRPDERGFHDSRIGWIRRLYRPQEEARLVRQAIGVDCLSLADRIVRTFGSESSIAGQLRLFAATDCVAEVPA